MLKCEDCCYFGYSDSVEYEHCCFRDWGHGDEEIAPCDDPAYENDNQPGYEEY